MGLKPTPKYSPLMRGLIFGGIIFIFVIIKDTIKLGTINGPVLLAALVGGIVGGGVYGLISWLRFRN